MWSSGSYRYETLSLLKPQVAGGFALSLSFSFSGERDINQRGLERVVLVLVVGPRLIYYHYHCGGATGRVTYQTHPDSRGAAKERENVPKPRNGLGRSG